MPHFAWLKCDPSQLCSVPALTPVPLVHALKAYYVDGDMALAGLDPHQGFEPWTRGGGDPCHLVPLGDSHPDADAGRLDPRRVGEIALRGTADQPIQVVIGHTPLSNVHPGAATGCCKIDEDVVIYNRLARSHPPDLSNLVPVPVERGPWQLHEHEWASGTGLAATGNNCYPGGWPPL